ncbi:MAG: hypothetical protein N2116_00780 [Armatimonadetes bacterium]|nr:hypothetical protein [Armatimonadota bacterium]
MVKLASVEGKFIRDRGYKPDALGVIKDLGTAQGAKVTARGHSLGASAMALVCIAFDKQQGFLMLVPRSRAGL